MPNHPMPSPVPTVPSLDGVWQGGWHRGAVHRASPNFGPRPAGAVVDLIVVHSISLPPGQYGGGAVAALFTNQLDWDAHPYYQSIRGLEVSAHFFIRRDGALWQFVDVGARAWHAGVSCYRGRSQCNDDSVGIELEGLEGDSFTPAQYATLVQLCADLAQHYPTIAHIAGHEHIAPGRKRDPGPGFDWVQLQRQLAWGSACFPQSAQG
ncbi:1,6-anhydro-N-acetylmuramyl-L-alanine amidase AmpD [Giesbergeria sinuosa]|uniref:1,6-anhydro-N-acetylmuramyl-L-alanine amidase AmpD n=2 Tax=Giesbergeria sinuosa TaxID=80883 RepID=A0ABV9Q9F8_9BURK